MYWKLGNDIFDEMNMSFVQNSNFVNIVLTKHEPDYTFLTQETYDLIEVDDDGNERLIITVSRDQIIKSVINGATHITIY